MEVTHKRAWDLTQEAWDSFLALLDPDEEEAGRKYESLRRKLITMFRSRQCIPPEDWADETLDRAIRKSQAEQIQNLPCYVLGVARRVASETYRSHRTEEIDADVPAPPPEVDSAAEQDRRMDCLEKCMQGLFPNERELIIEYYRYEKRLKIQTKMNMAGNMGISSGNLRVRAFRIRQQLERCVRGCVKASGTA